MSDMKTCTRCAQVKNVSLFYECKGKLRSECKTCTIKRSTRYQKKMQSWVNRAVDDESRKIYMRNYYEKNKEKFAEYRAEFVKRYPEYYKEYFRKRREIKNAGQ